MDKKQSEQITVEDLKIVGAGIASVAGVCGELISNLADGISIVIREDYTPEILEEYIEDSSATKKSKKGKRLKSWEKNKHYNFK